MLNLIQILGYNIQISMQQIIVNSFFNFLCYENIG